MSSRFCKCCRTEISEDAQGNCPKCGADLTLSYTLKKQPVLDVVASLIIPGLGQSYN